MRCFWEDRQRLHSPAGEFFNGAMHPAAEHAGRIDAMLAAIGGTEPPRDQGTAPLLRAHSADYVQFLQSAHSEWRAAGREGDAFPYTFPVVRRSTSAKSAYMPTPMAEITRRPAKTSGTRKLEEACSIR